MQKLILKKIENNPQSLENNLVTQTNINLENPHNSLLVGLNQSQQEAVETTEGAVLVVAGAGSGKTRVLTFRIAHILQKGVPAYQILALTFTNKAAAEMKERICKLVGEDVGKNLWMGTFHSVFGKILRMEAEKIGYTSSFSIYDSDDQTSVIKQIMASQGISTQDFSPKMIRSRISSAKNAMVTPQEYSKYARDFVEEKIALVYTDYEKKLRANNAMDFDDLLIRIIELFSKCPEVLEKYQNKFRYIVIDEYQDTNKAQYTVVNMLAKKWRNICVVGDDAQSIYKFRGADIKNILDFERDFQETKVIRLEQNYRSTTNILSAADSVIRNNRNQISKKLWTENEDGELIKVITLRDEKEEAQRIVQIIKSKKTSGKSYNDVAILYRTNAQSFSLEEGLRKSGIPYSLVGGVPFYRRQEVKDALSYLKLIVNSRDDESFNRIINVPARGIGDVSYKRLKTYAEEKNIPMLFAAEQANQVVDISPRTANVIKKFATMIESSASSLLAPVDIARGILSESGLLQSYKDEGTPEAIARWENVQSILSHLAEYCEKNPEGGLDTYLQEVALIADIDQYDSSLEKVTMMTIHSAKGLEFGTVIIAGMEEGLFPVGETALVEEELEEERRLCYVAITRAKQELVITNCERRYRFGQLQYPTASRFIQEIDSKLIEVVSNTMSHEHSSSAAKGQSSYEYSQTNYTKNNYSQNNYSQTEAQNKFNGQFNKSHSGSQVSNKQNNQKENPFQRSFNADSKGGNYNESFRNFIRDYANTSSKDKLKNNPPKKVLGATIPQTTQLSGSEVNQGVNKNINGSNPEEYSQVQPIRAGSIVKHPQFGVGKVVSIVGTGEKAKATVNFDTVGKKMLMLKFANLKLLS